MSEIAKYEAIISTKKQDEHSFLAALIPAISIPSEYAHEDEIHITDCAVIAANHGNNGRNKWAYVHLESAEKETIGNALVAACAKMNTWYWCNLYKEGLTLVEQLQIENEKLKKDNHAHCTSLMTTAMWIGIKEDRNKTHAEVERLLEEK